MNFPPPTERQARIIWMALTGLAVAALIGLLVGLVWGLGRVLHVLSPVIWPLAVAGVLACLLDPVVDFLVRKKVPRTRAIVVVFALALVIVAGLLASVVPQLVVETRQLASKMPAYKARLQTKAEQWISHPPELIRKYILHQDAPPLETPAPPAAAQETNVIPAAPITSTNSAPVSAPVEPPSVWPGIDRATLSSATAWITKALPAVSDWLLQVVGVFASVFGIIAGLALVPIYAFFFLLEKHGISAQWRDYLPVRDSKFKEELVFVLNAINEYLVAFFRGQVLVAICDGILYTIGFLIIGLPYAVLIGVMATFLTIIPFLGAITTCVTALIIAVVAFGDWQHPALVLAVFAVVQTLEGTVIQPKIMGDRVGLHPLVIIIALMVGTTLLGGILGGILAIPLAAALRVVMFRYVWKKRKV
jgi:predicted PurR-regulated permease PerM